MRISGVPAVATWVGFLVSLILHAAPKSLIWQSGQLESMKEVGAEPGGKWTSYVYDLQGKERSYTIVLPAPLKASVHQKVMFAVEKSLVYIHDTDGKVRKSCILEPAETARRKPVTADRFR